MAKPKKVRKSKTNPNIAKRGVGAAKQGVKKAANASAVIKKKTARKTKAVLGIGKAPKRTREATQGDLLRKGKSLLRGGNAALAAFIAYRYSAKAIARYQDYGLRQRRSIRLRRQVVEIDDNTFRIKGYIIKTSADGLTPYSCTCPDFSQFSTDGRYWGFSKAGPFNPCKHMMAVRDRDKGFWVCNNGVCTKDINATSGFSTRALCNASRNTQLHTGGQCDTLYNVTIYADWVNSSNVIIGSVDQSYVTNSSLANLRGPITSFFPSIDPFSGAWRWAIIYRCGIVYFTPTAGQYNWRANPMMYVERVDGLADNCGDAAFTCSGDVAGCTNPASPNYLAEATVDDGSCGVSGCTDPLADNYNPFATCDDGSCNPYVLGCTDPAADNYDPAATVNDGSCTYTILGCTDPLATNYDPAANTDDGSCTY